jgi:hypothetical protein
VSEPISLVFKIRDGYARVKRWLAVACLGVSVLLIYVRDLPGGVALQLLPLTVGLFAFVNFETLLELVGNAASRPPWEYRTLNDAVQRMCDLIEQEQSTLDIRIVAASGYSTVKDILPRLLDSKQAVNARLRLYVVNTDTPLKAALPENWDLETRAVVATAKKLCDHAGVHVEIYVYDYLPCVHGISINDTHLFLGYAGWKTRVGDPSLSAGNRPHRYYFKSDPGSKHFFYLFDDWTDNAPSRRVVPTVEEI